MCGIAGILNLNNKSIPGQVLKNMTDAIMHRGPDDEGFYIDSYIGLGHRRLAVIDTSPRGHQPMLTKDKRYVITYNGEVYNFKDIRSELMKKGYIFYSKTDTEVVLNAYAEWGTECLKHFNGIFAFAIWDMKKRELFMARDRYGAKPLYYAFKNKVLVFASEQKAIILHPEVKRDMDMEALLEYFTFQNIFTDKTLFKDIKTFPAGSWAKISFDDKPRQIYITKYWDFCFQEPDTARPEKFYVERLDYLFKQAVERQLVGDVPLGVYLSGGIDSSLITAIAAKRLPHVKTFTCGFDLHSVSGLERGFDERKMAELMAYVFKTEQYETVLKAGDMERSISDVAWHIEEPRIGQSYPDYYISKMASKFVKVVLSGAGGDELFAGYPWRYYYAASSNNFKEYIDKYYIYWHRLIDNKHIRKIFAPIWNDVKHVWTKDIFEGVFKDCGQRLDTPEDYVNHSLYFESKTFLHGLLLVTDKLSMAHSLETRVPFLDNDLVDFAMSVPVRLKLKNFKRVRRFNENELKKYFYKNNDSKLLLRKMAESCLPKKIAHLEKRGFSAPDASWFKGESIEYVKRMLFDSGAHIYDILDSAAIQKLVKEHFEGRVNRRLFIWSLLSVELWFRRYIFEEPDNG